MKNQEMHKTIVKLQKEKNNIDDNLEREQRKLNEITVNRNNSSSLRFYNFVRKIIID